MPLRSTIRQFLLHDDYTSVTDDKGWCPSFQLLRCCLSYGLQIASDVLQAFWLSHERTFFR